MKTIVKLILVLTLFVVSMVVFTDDRGVVVGIWLLCLIAGAIIAKREFDQ